MQLLCVGAHAQTALPTSGTGATGSQERGHVLHDILSGNRATL